MLFAAHSSLTTERAKGLGCCHPCTCSLTLARALTPRTLQARVSQLVATAEVAMAFQLLLAVPQRGLQGAMLAYGEGGRRAGQGRPGGPAKGQGSGRRCRGVCSLQLRLR